MLPCILVRMPVQAGQRSALASAVRDRPLAVIEDDGVLLGLFERIRVLPRGQVRAWINRLRQLIQALETVAADLSEADRAAREPRAVRRRVEEQ